MSYGWQDKSKLLGQLLIATSPVGRVEGEYGPTYPGTLTFKTDTGDVVWEAVGDCCSHSFFTDLKLQDIFGKKIVKIEDVEAMVDPALDPKTLVDTGATEGDYEAIYGIKLTAEDGSVGFVIFRNHSNGYYGGWVTEVGTNRWS